MTGPVGATSPQGSAPVGLRHALIPVHGYGIAGVTVARMLDSEGGGTARLLHPNEALPYGALPVLLAETTVYGATCVEQILGNWTTQLLLRPWLVLVSDAPARPVPEARYRIRALGSRLAGVARVPYLPVLRTVEGAG